MFSVPNLSHSFGKLWSVLTQILSSYMILVFSSKLPSVVPGPGREWVLPWMLKLSSPLSANTQSNVHNRAIMQHVTCYSRVRPKKSWHTEGEWRLSRPLLPLSKTTQVTYLNGGSSPHSQTTPSLVLRLSFLSARAQEPRNEAKITPTFFSQPLGVSWDEAEPQR